MDTKQPGLPRFARNDEYLSSLRGAQRCGNRNDGWVGVIASVARQSIGVLLLLCLGAPALAQDAPGLKLNASYAMQTDSNLFRLPAGVDTLALVGASSAADRIGVASAGLSFRSVQSLQKFELDASLVDYRYQNFSYLSFTARNYNAAWRWALTPRLTGNLTSERKQSINSFADYQNYFQSNQRTNNDTRLNAVYELTGPWRLVAGLAQARQTNQQALLVGGDDYTSNAADVGVRLLYGSGNSLTYSARRYDGNYLNRVPNAASLYDASFRQTEHDLRLSWVLSGKTSASANLAYLSRSHPTYSQRDYSGFNLGAAVNWLISGKSGLSADYTHQLESYQTSSSNYSQTDRISLGPVWQTSAKTALSLRHVWSQIDYLGAPGASASPARRDLTRDTTLSFNWQPYQQITLSAALQSATRGSNQPNLDYDSRMASVSAQYSY